MAAERDVQVRDAIRAANNALEHLREAADQLDSAESWGIFDMLGGGILATAAKHNRIDDAMEEVEAAQESIKLFSKKLAVLSKSAAGDSGIGDFLKFTDYVGGGIFADYLVQRKIYQLQTIVEETIYEVERMKARLVKGAI